MKYESEKQVCKDALLIYETGACNGSGISLSLHEMFCFLNHLSTDERNRHPAITLVLFQLAHLNKLIFIPGEHESIKVDIALAYCRRKVNEEETDSKEAGRACSPGR